MKVLLNLILIYVILNNKFALSMGNKDKNITTSKSESDTISNSESLKQLSEAKGATSYVTEIKLIKIDIKKKETDDCVIFEKNGSIGTFTPKPGYGIRKIQSSEILIWDAKNKLKSGKLDCYAIKVEIDGLGSKSKLITLYLANGKKEIFSKSSKYDSQQSESSPESQQLARRASCLKRRESKKKTDKKRYLRDGQKEVLKQSDVRNVDLKYEGDSEPSGSSGNSILDDVSDLTEKSQRSGERVESRINDQSDGNDNEGKHKLKRSESYKEIDGIGRSKYPKDVTIITRRKNGFGYGDEELMENDPGKCILKKQGENYEYEVKDDYEIIWIKYKGVTVWKHSGDPKDPVPKSVIYREETNLFTINMGQTFELKVQMSEVK